jgi:GNAT superfamily N-acetyltransferase
MSSAESSSTGVKWATDNRIMRSAQRRRVTAIPLTYARLVPRSPNYRPARVEDIPTLMSIRNSVRENALVSTVLTEDDYVRAMTTDGRAWVCEVDEEIVGFACGRTVQGDIWALFLRQTHEGRGIGNALMEIVERWMFEEGLDEIWLVTSPDTRAERLYRRRGWVKRGMKPTGEAEYVLTKAERAH